MREGRPQAAGARRDEVAQNGVDAERESAGPDAGDRPGTVFRQTEALTRITGGRACRPAPAGTAQPAPDLASFNHAARLCVRGVSRLCRCQHGPSGHTGVRDMR